jgi:prefoldin subunit 5
MGMLEKLLEGAGLNPTQMMQQAERLTATIQLLSDRIEKIEQGQTILNKNLGTVWQVTSALAESCAAISKQLVLIEAHLSAHQKLAELSANMLADLGSEADRDMNRSRIEGVKNGHH